jgi:hypothetical protein
MSAFVAVTEVSGVTLKTKTRVGNVEHAFVSPSPEISKLTFKEAYNEFVDVLYGKRQAVKGQTRAVILVKKTAYASALNGTDVVNYPDWKRVTNLKHEFKLVCGKKFKPEPKQEKPTTPAVEKTEGK